MHRRPAQSRGLRLGATAPGSASRQDGDIADVAAAEGAGRQSVGWEKWENWDGLEVME